MEKNNLYKKTDDKLKWLEENYHKFNFRKDLHNEMFKVFGLDNRQCYRIEKVFLGERKNTANINQYHKSKKASFIYGKKENCYFCEIGEDIIEHHISYFPEIIVFVCRKCHGKVHAIYKEYHQSQILLNKKIKDIALTINEINQRLNFVE